jgi:hypothetical protein
MEPFRPGPGWQGHEMPPPSIAEINCYRSPQVEFLFLQYYSRKHKDMLQTNGREPVFTLMQVLPFMGCRPSKERTRDPCVDRCALSPDWR